MTSDWRQPDHDGDLQAVLEAIAGTTHVEEVAALRRRLRTSVEPAPPTTILRHLLDRAQLPVGHHATGDTLHTVAEDGGMPSRLRLSWQDGGPLWVWRRWRPAAGIADGSGQPAAHAAPDGRWHHARPVVGIVGTRRPTADGLAVAGAMAAELADAGVEVVSGFARGIDQAAHRGALGAGGLTTAVLGTGLDVAYPAGSDLLRQQVAASGGLVTEHPHGTGVRHPKQFLARNRILAALCDAVVVIEAGRRSGALNTAGWAGEMGREVLVVPCSPSTPQGLGSLGLIRDGAVCVRDAADVIAALPTHSVAGHRLQLRATGDGEAARTARVVPGGEPVPPEVSGPARQVLGLLGPVPCSATELASRSGLTAVQVLSAVGELSAAGVARQVGGGVVRVPDRT